LTRAKEATAGFLVFSSGKERGLRGVSQGCGRGGRKSRSLTDVGLKGDEGWTGSWIDWGWGAVPIEAQGRQDDRLGIGEEQESSAGCVWNDGWVVRGSIWRSMLRHYKEDATVSPRTLKTEGCGTRARTKSQT
jgi:hypothetical protein